MKILRRGIMIDILKIENEYKIVNNQDFKFIKIKSNIVVDFIISEIAKHPFKEDELLKKGKSLGLNTSELVTVIQGLKDVNVIIESNFPEVTNYTEFINNKLLENYFDKRFGNMIVSLEEKENDKENRFDLFGKLMQSSIIIIGVGGIGGHIAIMAAASGIREITLIDKDIVEPSNLTRQTFYGEDDCNKVKKCQSLKNYLNKLNSSTKINIIDDYIDNDDKALKYLVNCSLVIQTADQPRGKLDIIVNRACIYNDVALIFCHNSSIGPLYIPNETGCYLCYMNNLKNENNEIYSSVEKIAANYSSVVWPSDPSSPMIASYYLFQEIINYLLGGDIFTKNAVLNLRKLPNQHQIKSFKIDELCLCQNCRINNNEQSTGY